MPGDEYAYAGGGGGGALRLKGAKVHKSTGKKKKRRDKTDLEKALSATGDSGGQTKGPKEDDVDGGPPHSGSGADKAAMREEDDEVVQPYKTEAERRLLEAKQKKLRELSESATARPELLKTHKERVEQLNTYLSKLSEHHDMPKIGPG